MLEDLHLRQGILVKPFSFSQDRFLRRLMSLQTTEHNCISVVTVEVIDEMSIGWSGTRCDGASYLCARAACAFSAVAALSARAAAVLGLIWGPEQRSEAGDATALPAQSRESRRESPQA